jgi:hypothetical protein
MTSNASTSKTTQSTWNVIGLAILSVAAVACASTGRPADEATSTSTSALPPATTESTVLEVEDGAAATTELADSTTTTSKPSSPVEVATQFWEALADGDRDATMALVDPDAIDSPGLSPSGRAMTLEGQFDWYDSVGWEWQLESCSEVDDGAIECTASARNSWSDSLGVVPVTGTFHVDVGDGGVTGLADRSGFGSLWAPSVFRVFAAWVDTNHPADAATMFDFDVDVNEEILGLYEVNTSRFVEAQSDG